MAPSRHGTSITEPADSPVVHPCNNECAGTALTRYVLRVPPVGGDLGLRFRETDVRGVGGQYIYLHHCAPGSPAEECGMRPGLFLFSVDGCSMLVPGAFSDAVTAARERGGRQGLDQTIVLLASPHPRKHAPPPAAGAEPPPPPAVRAPPPPSAAETAAETVPETAAERAERARAAGVNQMVNWEPAQPGPPPMPLATWVYQEQVNPDPAKREQNWYVYRLRLIEVKEDEQGRWFCSASKKQLRGGSNGDVLHMRYISGAGEEEPAEGEAHPSPAAGMGIGFYIRVLNARRVFMAPTQIERDLWVKWLQHSCPSASQEQPGEPQQQQDSQPQLEQQQQQSSQLDPEQRLSPEQRQQLEQQLLEQQNQLQQQQLQLQEQLRQLQLQQQPDSPQ